jgi:hypothetical protein
MLKNDVGDYKQLNPSDVNGMGDCCFTRDGKFMLQVTAGGMLKVRFYCFQALYICNYPHVSVTSKPIIRNSMEPMHSNTLKRGILILRSYVLRMKMKSS